MNKTIAVNIAGYVFHIEEDAYAALKNYLDTIASYFGSAEGRKEIMDDIEARIAEIFNERIESDHRVVTRAEVNHVIAVMGKPEDYREAEDQEQASSSRSSNDPRKIYRDTDHSVIGGVASGLSHYFGWDPAGLRIVFIILTFLSFSGVPIYFILWLVIPEARTTAEKLRMRGSRIDVDNISKTVSGGVESATATLKSKKVRKGIEQFVAGMGAIFGVFAKVLRVLIGVFSLVLGMTLAAAVVISILALLFGTNVPPMLSTGFMKHYLFIHPGWFYVTWVGLLLFLAVPVFGLIYAGIRLILNLHARLRGFGVVLVTALIFGSIILFTSLTFHLSEYSRQEQVTQTISLSASDSTEVIIKVANDPYWHSGISADDRSLVELVKVDNDQLVFGAPKLRFRPAEGRETHFTISRKANAGNVDAAIEHAKNINYGYNVSDSVLLLNPFYTSPTTDRFRGQQLLVTVYIGKGDVIRLDEGIERLLTNDHGLLPLRKSDVSQHAFTSRRGKITCLTCPKDPSLLQVEPSEMPKRQSEL